MRKILIFFVVGHVLFYSCHVTPGKQVKCYENLRKAADLAYKNPNNTNSLDSALIIVNKYMECDSIRTAVVDLKIHLLLALGKYKEGVDFMKSLQVSDFTYLYKKKLNYDNFVALNFALNNDTITRDKVYKKMVTYLEKYIVDNNLKSEEFQEAVIELYELLEKLADTTTLNRLLGPLKTKYPNEDEFLDFFKRQ